MLLKSLERKECSELLRRVGFGRLGCANNNQPYVVPIYFALESEQLFAFSTEGQKIGWMRENPLVCVEADEIKSEREWTSVLAKGRYEELPDNPRYAAERLLAHSLLEKRIMGELRLQLRRYSLPLHSGLVKVDRLIQSHNQPVRKDASEAHRQNTDCEGREKA